MTSKYTNKNGVKLLAAMLVMAIALAGAFVFISEDGDAASTNVTQSPVSGDVTVVTGSSYYVDDSASFVLGTGEASSTITALYVAFGATVQIQGGITVTNMYWVDTTDSTPVFDSDSFDVTLVAVGDGATVTMERKTSTINNSATVSGFVTSMTITQGTVTVEETLVATNSISGIDYAAYAIDDGKSVYYSVESIPADGFEINDTVTEVTVNAGADKGVMISYTHGTLPNTETDTVSIKATAGVIVSVGSTHLEVKGSSGDDIVSVVSGIVERESGSTNLTIVGAETTDGIYATIDQLISDEGELGTAVTIVGDQVITKNKDGKVSISGAVAINNVSGTVGSTLTIKSGVEVTIGGAVTQDSLAKIVNNGVLVITAAVTVDELENNGTILVKNSVALTVVKKLVNNGTLTIGVAEDTEAGITASPGTLTVTAADIVNGSNASIVLANAGAVVATSGKVTNAGLIEIKTGGATFSGSTNTNSGEILVGDSMTLTVGTLTNTGSIDNLGTISITTKIDNQAAAEDSIKNGGLIEVGGAILLGNVTNYAPEGGEIGKIIATSAPAVNSSDVVTAGMDTYFAVMKKSGAEYLYYVYGDKDNYDLKADDSAGYIQVTAGTLIADGTEFTVFTDSKFVMTAYGDLVSWNGSISSVSSAVVEDLSTDGVLLSASLKVAMIGGKITVAETKAVEFMTIDVGAEAAGDFVLSDAFAIIPADVTITFTTEKPIKDGTIFVYGNIDSKGIANPKNCIDSVTNPTEVVLPGASDEKVAAINGFTNAPLAPIDVIADTVDEVISAFKYVDTVVWNCSTNVTKDITIPEDCTLIAEEIVLEGATMTGGTISGPILMDNASALVGVIVDDDVTIGNPEDDTDYWFVIAISNDVETTNAISLSVDEKVISFAGNVLNSLVSFDSIYSIEVGADSAFTNVYVQNFTFTDDVAEIQRVHFMGIETVEGFTVSAGSVMLSGDVVLTGNVTAEAENALTIADGTTISAAAPVVITVPDVTILGEVELGENVTIIVASGATLTVDTGAKVTGDGKIEIDGGVLVNDGTIDVTIEADNYTLEITSGEQLVSNIDDFTSFKLKNSITLSGEFEIPAGITIDLNGKTIYIAGEVKVTKANLYNGNIYVEQNASFTLNEAEVWCAVDSYDEDGIVIEKATTTTISNDSLRSIYVGYGNTLVLDNYTVRNGHSVNVYGNLVVKTTATILEGGEITLLGTSTATIDGTLKVEGKLSMETEYVDPAIIINGQVTVGNDKGTAKIDGVVEISETGTLTIAKSKDPVYQNRLDGTVLNYGTLTINGEVAAADIYNYGTLNFNGRNVDEEDPTIIHIMDGVTVNFASVTGTIIVDDLYSAVDAYDENGELEDDTIVVYGNTVTISNAKNVTVSVSVASKLQKFGDDSYMVYTSSMTVSGTISDVDTKDALAASVKAVYVKTVTPEVSAEIYSDLSKGKLNVKDVALGEKVTMTLTGATVGDITAVSKESVLNITSGTISGLVTVGPDASSNVASSVNTTKYTVTATDGKITTYYTNLADAIAAASAADEKTVTVYGTSNKVESALEIGSGIKVVLNDGAKITISSKGELTVAADALLDASKGAVDVQGTLTVMDKDEAFNAPTTTGNFTYQVSKVTDQVIVYSGLAGALKAAESGDVITIQQNATISEDLEIKEGVTLVIPKGKTLSIGNEDKDIALTVNGKLEVQKGGVVTKADNAQDVEFVVNGVITDDISNRDNFSGMEIYNFVAFQLDKKTVCYSNIVYASENASFGNVTIVGTHSVGDITFTKATDAADLTVILSKFDDTFGTKDYSLSVNSLTLKGAQIVVVGAVSFNGTIVGASDNGTASIVFEDASGFVVGQYAEAKVTGNVDHLVIASVDEEEPVSKFIGKMTVATGIVTIGVEITNGESSFAYDDMIVTGAKTNSLTVAEGATLVVPKGSLLFTNCTTTDKVLFVDGTLFVDEGYATIYDAEISGTMVIEGKNVYLYNTAILGNIDVKTDDKVNDVAAGLLRIGAGVSIGDAPSTIGANGTITGDVEFASSTYLVVYAGADLSAAKIEWNNATEKTNAKVTEFFINGVSYMTVYAKNTTTPLSIANGLGIELVGYDTPADIVWYSDDAMTMKISNGNVGEYSKVYAEFGVSGIKGKISVGTGIGFYVDGLKVNSDGGESYDNSYTLSVGEHTVFFDKQYGYDVSKVKILFNGKEVSNNGKITITADMKDFTLTVSGAVPSETPVTPVEPTQPTEKDDGMGITEYLLIVLVILAAILVVVVAIRMMRS